MKYLIINRRSIICAVLAVIVASSGCKKGYLDVNDDPNRVTDKNITPELLFTQAAHGVGARLGSVNLRFLNNWMGYFSAAGDYAIEQDETSYNVDFTFGDAVWRNTYNVLFDLYLTKQKAMANGDSVLAGASMILSARLFQDLVDIYGNIPYSQAFQANTYNLPAYDKAQDVYNSLQHSLDSAVTFMKAKAKSSFAGVDIVNGASQSLWIKFANSLKLRLLIRQSEMAGFNPASELVKIQNNGDLLKAGENVDANPGYKNEQDKQSPFYATYGKTPTGSEASPSTRANQFFIDLLTAYPDPRLDRFFNYVTGTTSIVGTVYGKPEGNPAGSKSSSIGRGLADTATQSQWIFPSFESLFIQAEAQVRGWLPGDAQATYKSAVIESFKWLKVEDAEAEANDYMTNISIANWANSGSSVKQKAQFIAFQKYIALCGVDPIEAWSDLRRLNMIPFSDYISVNPARISNSVPVRLLYPQSEYTTNGGNVRAQGAIDLFKSKIFWQP